MEKEETIQEGMIERTFDLPFYPYDDISYHKKEENKDGVRVVVIIPSGYVETTYVKRRFGSIADVMRIDDTSKCPLNRFVSETICYNSNEETKELTVISINYTDHQLCCIRYNDEPLIFADACIITGHDFTDLTMEQCYSLVSSARAAKTENVTSVFINIKDDMDMIPRLVYDEE